MSDIDDLMLREYDEEEEPTALRLDGWIRLDDPVDGLVVEHQCGKTVEVQEPGRTTIEPCPYCDATGIVTRPLTVGEALELLSRAYQSYHSGKYIIPDLTSGARVRVKK